MGPFARKFVGTVMQKSLVMALLLASVEAARGAGVPQESSIEYVTAGGRTNVCLVEAPTHPAPEAAIVIYMHGAGRDESQGMTLFPILRQQLAAKGWIYVSPRHYEFDGLMADLTARFGKRRVYLAGASAGARVSFEEICRKPETYAGQFLIGPALRYQRPALGRVTVPTFIIYGDLDGQNTASANLVTDALKRQKVPVKDIVVKGDGHEAPYGKQDWWYEALTFVTGEEFKAP
jgi:predicted esterase